MKLQFISVVAAFLLCSVIAERNGPTNIRFTPRRRFNKSFGENQSRRSSGGRSVINITTEDPNKARRLSSTLKITGVFKTPKISHRKFPGITTPKNPFVKSRGYIRRQKSETNKTPRKFSATKFQPVRKSFDLGIESNHLPITKFNNDAIFLEPVLHHKSKISSFGYSITEDFTPDSNNILGPLIGPLNLPGIGKNVHMRLMVPSDEEATSHVIVHLVNKRPVEIFSDIYKSIDFVHPEKPKSLFSGEKSVIFSPILPKKLPVSIPVQNSQRNRSVDKSVYTFDLTPPKVGSTLEYFGVQKHSKIPQEMVKNQPDQFNNPQQYFAAPNHHQLPVAMQAADNLKHLPIYPPLFAQESKNEKELDKNKSNVSADSQIDMENIDDNQQSASLKHTLVSRNYLNFQSPWRGIRVPLLPEPNVVISNRRESPEPEFMEEITPPDLSSGNISRKKLNDGIILNNDREYSFWNLHLKNTSLALAQQEDKHLVMDSFHYSARQYTTTSRTSHSFSHDKMKPDEDNGDDHDDEIQSTTSNILLTDTSSKIRTKNKNIQ